MARSVVRNAADEKQVAFGGKHEARQAQLRRELVRDQMATARGREYVWAQLEAAGVYDIHDGPLELVYARNAVANEGRRLLAELMTLHPDAFLHMQAEALLRAKQGDRALEQTQPTGDPE